VGVRAAALAANRACCVAKKFLREFEGLGVVGPCASDFSSAKAIFERFAEVFRSIPHDRVAYV